MGPIDTSQEGRAFNNNTTFSGFDDSLRTDTIQAFEMALDRIENTCSSITGVFRERLNGIQQKDAVANVAVGVQNSYTVTRHIYQQMDTLTVDILGDCLDQGKIVWKKGLTGVLILGDKGQKIFTALPKHFTHTDYDIHITSSTQIMQEMKAIQQIVLEFIKSGQVDPDITVDALTARSMTELKAKVAMAFGKRRKEQQNMGQMQQQNEQLQQQLQQIQAELQKAQGKIENLNETKLQIEQKKAQDEADIKWYQARTERDFKSNQSDNDTKRTDIEYAQLFDGNNMNDKIKNA